MLSSHLILCHPLLLLPLIPPSIRVFPNKSTLRTRWPKYWSFSFSISPSVECLPAMRETQVRFLDREDPLEKKWQSTPAHLPRKSHGQRSLIGYSPWDHKESDTTERLHFHFPKNTQDWSPLELTGWISLQSKGLSTVFSNTTVQKHQFFSTQLSSQSNSHIHTWLLENPEPWLDGPLLVK